MPSPSADPVTLCGADFASVSPHDLARLRLAGVFVLIERRKSGVRLLAAGWGAPISSSPLALGCWSRHGADGLNEALVHPCACKDRCADLAAALMRSIA